MYHIDRDIPIPEKLNAWAMHFSHAYLEHHDPSSLALDTFTMWTPMETDQANEWIPVVTGRRNRNKSPPAPVSTTNPKGDSNNLARKQPGKMHDLPYRKSNQNPQLALIKDWSRYQKLVKPASRPPQVSTVHEDADEDVTPIDEEDTQLNSASTPWSSVTRPPPFPTIAVNDGTHRVTLKWNVQDNLHQYENGPDKLTEDVQNLLTNLSRTTTARSIAGKMKI